MGVLQEGREASMGGTEVSKMSAETAPLLESSARRFELVGGASMAPMRGPIVWLAALGALGLLVIMPACGGGGTSPGTASEIGAEGTNEADVTMAFDFTLDTVGGEAFRLSDSASKVHLIDFWATWCAPCREEIPMLNELQASYGDRGFRVLGISDPDEDVDLVRKFVEQNGMEFLVLVGTEEVNEAYGVLGLPAAYLVDRQGRVVDMFMGPKPRRVLVKKIEALLDEEPAT
jgi:thiol-disulfide isomerase/thioredoxin